MISRFFQWLSSWFNYYSEQDECFEMRKFFIIPEDKGVDIFECNQDTDEECLTEIYDPYFNIYKK